MALFALDGGFDRHPELAFLFAFMIGGFMAFAAVVYVVDLYRRRPR
jgi:hypothetical protein